MTTRTKRQINAAVWASLAIIVCTTSAVAWAKHGAGNTSIAVAVLFYSSIQALMWLYFDLRIKEKGEQ